MCIVDVQMLKGICTVVNHDTIALDVSLRHEPPYLECNDILKL